MLQHLLPFTDSELDVFFKTVTWKRNKWTEEEKHILEKERDLLQRGGAKERKKWADYLMKAYKAKGLFLNKKCRHVRYFLTAT